MVRTKVTEYPTSRCQTHGFKKSQSDPALIDLRTRSSGCVSENLLISLRRHNTLIPLRPNLPFPRQKLPGIRLTEMASCQHRDELTHEGPFGDSVLALARAARVAAEVAQERCVGGRSQPKRSAMGYRQTPGSAC